VSDLKLPEEEERDKKRVPKPIITLWVAAGGIGAYYLISGLYEMFTK